MTITHNARSTEMQFEDAEKYKDKLRDLSYYQTFNTSLSSGAVTTMGVRIPLNSDAKLAGPFTAQEAAKDKTGTFMFSRVPCGAGQTSRTLLSYFCDVERTRKLVILMSRLAHSSFPWTKICRPCLGSETARPE